LAGEICTILALVMSSTTLSVTEDDAAPMIADTFLEISSVTDCVATSALSASDESVCSTVTSSPSTPPASLISSIARSTPAISGGPRYASDPVCGRSVPRTSGPDAESDAPSVALSSLSPPPLEHAARISAAAPASAAARTACVERIIRGTPL